MSRRRWLGYPESPTERARRERREGEEGRRRRAEDADYRAWMSGNDPDDAYDREYDRDH